MKSTTKYFSNAIAEIEDASYRKDCRFDWEEIVDKLQYALKLAEEMKEHQIEENMGL